MKVLMINVVCGIRSTGRICTDLATALEAQGHEVKIAYGRENVPEQFQKYAVRIGTDFDVKLHGLKARLFDGAGFGSRVATERFIKWVKEYDPDIIHLHNIHGYYLNVEVLFDYLNTCGKRVIWTLHDCWAFTGHCCYYSAENCTKWMTGCNHCELKSAYPQSFLDMSKRNYTIKRTIFSSLKDMVLVTPSEWLADQVKKSFLGNNKVLSIPNGIDLDKYRMSGTWFKQKKYIENTFMLLGVASIWEERKGLNDFITLRTMLPEKYTIVLVGLSAKQIRALPKGIIGIERTNSIEELVDIYSSADVFLNLSVEETMGLTTVEAMACGTPSIVYNETALPEVVDVTSGIVVEAHDFEALLTAIDDIEHRLCEFSPRNRANQYDKRKRFGEYISLYLSLIGEIE